MGVSKSIVSHRSKWPLLKLLFPVDISKTVVSVPVGASYCMPENCLFYENCNQFAVAACGFQLKVNTNYKKKHLTNLNPSVYLGSIETPCIEMKFGGHMQKRIKSHTYCKMHGFVLGLRKKGAKYFSSQHIAV